MSRELATIAACLSAADVQALQDILSRAVDTLVNARDVVSPDARGWRIEAPIATREPEVTSLTVNAPAALSHPGLKDVIGQLNEL